MKLGGAAELSDILDIQKYTMFHDTQIRVQISQICIYIYVCVCVCVCERHIYIRVFFMHAIVARLSLLFSKYF